MIPFFRKIRKQYADNNQFLNYSRYAIGEIVLVVIGILIALQINNWQKEKQNIKLEGRYLEDLVNDLKQDSLNLKELYLEAQLTADAKDSLYKVINDPEYKIDSIPEYFRRQWEHYKIFSPSTATIEEMKSSSHLEIIRDDASRKQIVSIYYKYKLFLQDEELFSSATREIFTIARNNLKNIDNPSSDDIKLLLQDQRLANTIRKNFAKGRLKSIENMSGECHRLLEGLIKYRARISK